MSFEIRSLQESELSSWFTHLSQVFKGVGREYFMNHWFEDPHRDLGGILVAMDNDVIASTVRVFARRIHLGGAVLNMGGIGEVSTKEEYRQQGLSGRLLEAAINYMQQRSCATSILFTGLTSHYQRYGWEHLPVPAWRLGDWSGEIKESSGVAVRPINYGDDLYGLYHIHKITSECMAGAVARSADYWWTYIRRRLQQSLVAERAGEPVAYLLAELADGVLRISEFGVLPGAEGALCNLIIAARNHLSAPTNSPISLPPVMDQFMGGALRALAGNVEERSRQPMYRVVNVLALATQMRPVWEARLLTAEWHGKLLIDTGVGPFLLQMADGQLRVSESGSADMHIALSHYQFLSLLYSGQLPSADGLAEEARKMLAVLFPPLQNVFWTADGF